MKNGKKIAVIGSGLSGITVASLIKKKNNVEIFEKKNIDTRH